MLRISCPYCGLRDHTEFTYGGDATLRRPDSETGSDAAWEDYVYLRDDPKGPHQEYWHHVQGCRAWLVVSRDTLTHAIAAVRPAGTEAGR